MVFASFLLALSFIDVVLSAPDPAPAPYIPPINEDDPELYQEWTTPKTFDYWWRYSVGAEYVGLLYGGRSEFPYIVDIRSIDVQQEDWSTGNLVTRDTVLTSCRSVQFFLDFLTLNDRDTATTEGHRLALKEVAIIVNYCGVYLWEDYKFASALHHLSLINATSPSDDVPDAGSRYVEYIYVHPDCKDLSFDIGIMKLLNPINPHPPFINSLPLWYDADKRTITRVDLQNMVKQRRICYIASFGRNWANLYESYVVDYKVKYRVYYEPEDNCIAQLEDYRRTQPDRRLFWIPGKEGDEVNLMCFKTRARVSAVCDHDRGAPLVCDSLIYGFVARGANFTKCNNLLSLPFLVQRASVINDYIANIVKHTFVEDYSPKAQGGSGRVMITSSTLIYSFLTSLYVSLTAQRCLLFWPNLVSLSSRFFLLYFGIRCFFQPFLFQVEFV